MAVTALRPDSAGQAWVDCLAYLEAHCNHRPDLPYPPETVRYCQLLWVLTEALAATSVLEIGIGPFAMSGVTFVHAMGARGGGRLFSIDVERDRPDPAYRALAASKGVEWTVLHGDSLALTTDLPPSLQVDVLYIDGDHDLVHAYGDTVGYYNYLRPGGYLLIDDYPGCSGVLAARPLLRKHDLEFLHVAHHPPHDNGRLLLQRGSREHGEDIQPLPAAPRHRT